MKRIKEACLLQTIHFQLRENLPREAAARAVREEYEHYRKGLDRTGVKYRITQEETLEDGSIVIGIQKQYNHHPCGNYLE